MKMYWQESAFETKIFDEDQKLIGVYYKAGSKPTRIGGLLFYMELDSELNASIIMQDKNYKQHFCTYKQLSNSFNKESSSAYFQFDNYKLDFIPSKRPYLQLDNKIIIDYWKDSGFFKRTGSITIFGLKEHWQMLTFCIIYAKNIESTNWV